MTDKPLILIVDDDESYRSLAVKQFKKMKKNFQIITAADGYMALDILKESNVDLVLTDYEMPGMNGMKTFEKIKKIQPHLPVIMMSSSEDKELPDAFLREGGLNFMKKPFNQVELKLTVEHALKDKKWNDKLKKRILIVEDSPEIRKMIRRCLQKENYEIEEAENGETALKKVQSQTPDLLLIDVMMPGMDGFEVCKKLREAPESSPVYIIMLTAIAESQSVVTGLDCGADDYIIKPFVPEELRARVRTGLRTANEKNSAITDALTKLYNRHFFNAWLEQEAKRAKRYEHPLSLVMIDLDHFKQVNDTFGHDAGDVVLAEVAEIIREHGRKTDLPVRWGGEEFLLLLPETHTEGAKKLAEKIRLTIKNHYFPHVGFLTASLGVAMLSDSKEDLLKRADQALYQAKENGRDQVKIA